MSFAATLKRITKQHAALVRNQNAAINPSAFTDAKTLCETGALTLKQGTALFEALWAAHFWLKKDPGEINIGHMIAALETDYAICALEARGLCDTTTANFAAWHTQVHDVDASHGVNGVINAIFAQVGVGGDMD
jgi:hypothetical protein